MVEENSKDDACIFCKIIKGEIPSNKIYEDEHCFVIPDKFPVMKGQCLVVSKKHIDYAFNLDDTTYNHLFTISKKIAKSMDKSLNTKRTCLVVEGFQVPHTHIKLFPTFGDILKIHGGKEASNEELIKLVSKIKDKLNDENS